MDFKDRYTVLLVPQHGGATRKLSFSKGGVRVWKYAILAVGALLAVNLMVFVYLYVVDRGNIFSYLSFKSENKRLKTEQEVHVQNIQDGIDELKDHQAEALARMAEIEIITGFQDFNPKVFLSAKGGPSKQADLDALDPEAMVELRRRLSGVDQDHKEIRERIQKIQLFVRANEERMRQTPAGWPVKGWVSSNYGWRPDPWTRRNEFHDGLDVSAWYGTAIRAAADGTVKVAERYGGYGKVVVIAHQYGYETYYGHMSRIAVKARAPVKRGDVIGYVGSSGRSTGAHVHYEIRVNNRPVDPWPYLGLMP